MEEFITNMALASFGLIILAGVVLTLLNWLEEQYLTWLTMDLGDWIMLAIFFGIAAIIASTM
jgi:hypothetical protein